jgi:deazaflavin-dependent oxidoreductase (nitroreductase family)
MAGFEPAVNEAAMREEEIDLTTFGRKSGTPYRKTLYIFSDGRRLFVRAGGGRGRDWPRNLLANARGILHIAERDIPVRASHVTDPAEARAGSALRNRKYQPPIPGSAPGEPLTLAEQAMFELTPEVESRIQEPGARIQKVAAIFVPVLPRLCIAPK